MTGAKKRRAARSRYPVMLVALLCLMLASSPVMAQQVGSPSDPAWQQSVERIVERYLQDHPEAIEKALQSLEEKRQVEAREQAKAVIAARQPELVNDAASLVGGNPSGDLALVEFFDYRCGFCKRIAPVVAQLQKDDPKVRVVYKDFAILGENSELAARAALASKAQPQNAAFHDALLAAKEELTREAILKIAGEVGLDISRLDSDMNKPEWSTVIERNRALAQELGITGTPAFVVGQELHVGVLDLPTLKELVARARPALAPKPS